MASIGPMELLLVLGLALLVLGPKRLPDAGRAMGRGMREFKDAVTGVRADDQPDPAPASPAVAAAEPAPKQTKPAAVA
jgi:sec-independent protein translocase protein TatA